MGVLSSDGERLAGPEPPEPHSPFSYLDAHGFYWPGDPADGFGDGWLPVGVSVQVWIGAEFVSALALTSPTETAAPYAISVVYVEDGGELRTRRSVPYCGHEPEPPADEMCWDYPAVYPSVRRAIPAPPGE
jgi:hypothetical protein